MHLTFISVLVVVAILAGCGRPNHTPERVAMVVVSKSYEAPLLAFKVDVGRYPNSAEGLEVLVHEPVEGLSGWNGPYVREIYDDPWGNPYQYRSPGIHNPDSYDLWSLGPDGVPSDDDIGNW